MIGRPSRRLWLDAAKAEFAQIKLIDKDIDRPDRIVLAQVVIQPLGKQRALAALIANDKTRYPIFQPNRRRIVSSKPFSHSLRSRSDSQSMSGSAELRVLTGYLKCIIETWLS